MRAFLKSKSIGFKFFIFILLAFVLVFALDLVSLPVLFKKKASESPPRLAFSLKKSKARVGDLVEIPIALFNNDNQVVGVDMVLEYDQSVLEFVELVTDSRESLVFMPMDLKKDCRPKNNLIVSDKSFSAVSRDEDDKEGVVRFSALAVSCSQLQNLSVQKLGNIESGVLARVRFRAKDKKGVFPKAVKMLYLAKGETLDTNIITKHGQGVVDNLEETRESYQVEIE